MKIKYLTGIAATLALLTASCDEVSQDERYIKVPAAKVERTVLLEDFTGQGCVNCPAAHRIIEGLEMQYGDHLAAVSIHAGVFGVPADNKRYTGLMQPEGQTYNDRYGIDEYPQGVVDGSGPLNADQWAKAVYDAVSQKTPLSIDLAATCDGSEIAIDCSLVSGEALAGSLFLWITESGIVARQEDEEQGRINDYVHNNVFRACVNGIDGEPVSLAPGEPRSVTHTVAVKSTDTEKWNAANLSVVAFVKRGSKVEQAAKCRVTTDNVNNE